MHDQKVLDFFPSNLTYGDILNLVLISNLIIFYKIEY